MRATGRGGKLRRGKALPRGDCGGREPLLTTERFRQGALGEAYVRPALLPQLAKSQGEFRERWGGSLHDRFTSRSFVWTFDRGARCDVTGNRRIAAGRPAASYRLTPELALFIINIIITL